MLGRWWCPSRFYPGPILIQFVSLMTSIPVLVILLRIFQWIFKAANQAKIHLLDNFPYSFFSNITIDLAEIFFACQCPKSLFFLNHHFIRLGVLIKIDFDSYESCFVFPQGMATVYINRPNKAFFLNKIERLSFYYSLCSFDIFFSILDHYYNRSSASHYYSVVQIHLCPTWRQNWTIILYIYSTEKFYINLYTLLAPRSWISVGYPFRSVLRSPHKRETPPIFVRTKNNNHHLKKSIFLPYKPSLQSRSFPDVAKHLKSPNTTSYAQRSIKE